MIFVDAGVLVRYLTGAPLELADGAERLLDGTDEADGETIYLSPTVLLETAAVLKSVYQLPREEIMDALGELVQKRNFKLPHGSKETLLRALALCRSSGRVSLGDALLWASAHDAGRAVKTVAVVASFDPKFPSEGIEVRTEF